MSKFSVIDPPQRFDWSASVPLAAFERCLRLPAGHLRSNQGARPLPQSFCTTAHGRHDTDLGFAFDWNLQSVSAANDLAVNKHIDMRPHFASLSQYSIAQPGVCLPKLIQSIADSLSVAIDLDLGLAGGKFS